MRRRMAAAAAALTAPPTWSLLAAAGVAQVVLAFATVGIETDMANYLKVSHVLRGDFGLDPLHLYSLLNPPHVNPPGWPYLPGITPWFVLAAILADGTGLPFHGIVQLPLIAGTIGTAYYVHRVVLRDTRDEVPARLALLLVAVGPLYVMVSGWMGQLDSLAFLPALVGVVAWQRGGERRWLVTGLLIGVATAVKVVPAFLLVALLPSARSVREAAGLVVASAAIPLLVLAPFLAADWDGVTSALTRYSGLLGKGGLGLFAQPDLSHSWVLGGLPERPNSVVAALHDGAKFFTLGALGAAAAAIARFRPAPLAAAAGLYLLLLGTGVNLTYHWLLWPLPFLIAARRLWLALYLQLAVFGAQLMLHYGPSHTWLADVYPPYMWVLQIVLAGSGVALLVRSGSS